MGFVSFNSMPNLIVILFNLLYPVFIVGFDCKGCVIERKRVCEDSSNWKLKSFHGYLATKHPAKWCMCPANNWNVNSQDRIETASFRECLASKAFLWDTHETVYFAILSYLLHYILTHTIYTIITNRCWGVLLRENPSHKLWELEIVIPTILYTIACGFSSTSTSPFPYHWEVDGPNTYHTLSECLVRFWCYWEALKEARLWRMQSGILQDSES